MASSADRCLNGVLQYRFWIDGNGDNAGGDPLDKLLRNWTDNPAIVDAPLDTTTYVMDVRCSTDFACEASTSVIVTVLCPASGNLGFPNVTVDGTGFAGWGSLQAFEYCYGDLADLRTYGTITCGSGNDVGQDICFDDPAPGQGYYWVWRETGTIGTGGTGFCNDPGITWGNPDRDAALP